MPLAYKTTLNTISCFPEFDRSDEAAIKEFSQKFFGQSFDFVRRIEESNGTLIYMYGYGQKVLTFANGNDSNIKKAPIPREAGKHTFRH